MIISVMRTMSAPSSGAEPEPEPRSLGDDIEHPAVRDVHEHGPEVRDLDRRVEMGREGRHVPEGHAADLAVVDSRRVTRMRPAGDSSVSSVVGSVIGSRPVSSSTVTTHIVLVPDMPGVFDLLHDHVAGLSLRVRGRQDEVAVGRRVAARLAQHPQAQVVAVGLEPGHRLEHRAAGHALDAADDDPPGFAGGVGIDSLDDGADPQSPWDRRRATLLAAALGVRQLARDVALRIAVGDVAATIVELLAASQARARSWPGRAR